MLRALAVFSGAVLAVAACTDSSVPSPFEVDAGAGGEASVPGPDPDPEPDIDRSLGGPCSDDGQCDDGIECTNDVCDDELGRCRFIADDDPCQNEIYCDGQEVCEPGIGCTSGEPITCDDGMTCTIDQCVEEDRSCRHFARDADGDGDSVWNCPGGGDCNDADPLVSSLVSEVCENQIDDDCDGEIDELECVRPMHDTCSDPLEVSASGSHVVSLAAAAQNYSASCLPEEAGFRDVVVALSVPPGDPVDVDVIATAPRGAIALSASAQCASLASEIACSGAFTQPAGGSVSRLRLRALTEGTYALTVFSASESEITLKFEYGPASGPPANPTCGTASVLSVGEHQQVELEGDAADAQSACPGATGDRFFRFELSEPQDVTLFAAPLDAYGIPSISLRGGGCLDLGEELTCRRATQVELFERALPAGEYSVRVAGSGPADVDLLLETGPVSQAPPDDHCATAPDLAQNALTPVSLAEHVDSVRVSCMVGAPDAVYRLALEEKSDVLLLGRAADDDQGALSLLRPACGSENDVLACKTGSDGALRVAARGVPAGEYRVVVESAAGHDSVLSALVRPASLPNLVAFADRCEDAIEIPESGGLFQGNTATAAHDYSAGCDTAGAPDAPDQMLKLTLSERRRVVFDMAGSGYETLLDVRRGPSCPGDELSRACTAGFVEGRSFLDLILDAGEYFVQIDGFAGARGPWMLDVHVVEPP